VNSKLHRYVFLVETFDEMGLRISNHILRIPRYCWKPEDLLYCVKEDAIRVIELELEPQREQSETTYPNDGCPVCLEKYNENIEMKVAICGHCLCNGCWKHITQSNNSICPECREVWNEVKHYDELEYDLDDIEELCFQNDNATLLEIIDDEALIEMVFQSRVHYEILGYEGQTDNTEGLDRPLKYRQLPFGENQFKILWNRLG
jgi:hypothetical protein